MKCRGKRLAVTSGDKGSAIYSGFSFTPHHFCKTVISRNVGMKEQIYALIFQHAGASLWQLQSQTEAKIKNKC